ncbi:MAG: hypothetical protein AMS27_15460, partial [Bacteroides sp. SM23_62_1]
EEDVSDFVQCMSCSFVYADPFIAGTNYFYSLAYHSNASYYEWKWEYQVTYDDIESFIKKNNSQKINLLEVGAGNGAFIKKISPRFIPKEKVMCIEFSDYGRKEILKYGINCISEDLKNINTNKFSIKFDIICMFQVLEHLDRLHVVFENLNKLSNEEALLYIAVPNNKHREFYDEHRSYFDIPPTHISRWNIESFKVLGERYGWIVLNHASQPEKGLKKLRQFMFNRYYHFKKISSRIDKINLPIFNKLLKLTTFAIFFAIYFYSIMKLIFGDFGTSQWICLKKH